MCNCSVSTAKECLSCSHDGINCMNLLWDYEDEQVFSGIEEMQYIVRFEVSDHVNASTWRDLLIAHNLKGCTDILRADQDIT